MVQVYFDDIIIFSGDLEVHYSLIDKVFTKLASRKVIVEFEKTEYLRSSCKYLGYVIDATGVSPNTAIIEMVQQIKPPANKNELQKVLGILGWNSKFIANYANNLRRTIRMLRLKPEDPFEWTEEMTQELKTVVEQLKGNPKFYYPNFDKGFNLYTDASAWGLGWFLTQGQGEDEHMITSGHKTLNKDEQKLSTTDRELEAIELAASQIKRITNGMPVEAYTDHQPLTQCLKEYADSERIARFLRKIQNGNIRIHYIKGSLNSYADALSRMNPKFYAPEVNRVIKFSDLPESKKVSLHAQKEEKIRREQILLDREIKKQLGITTPRKKPQLFGTQSQPIYDVIINDNFISFNESIPSGLKEYIFIFDHDKSTINRVKLTNSYKKDYSVSLNPIDNSRFSILVTPKVSQPRMLQQNVRFAHVKW